jgi:hypothetical protein
MKIISYFLVFGALISCGKNKVNHSIQQQASLNKDSVNTINDEELWNKYEAWQETKSYINNRLRDTLVLKRLETQRDEVLITLFLKQHDSLKKFDYMNLEELLHTIDIDGDGQKDIVFEGSSGSEAFVTHIYINKPDGFTPVFSGFQYIQKPEFKDGKLTSFVLLNPGCCADPGIIEQYYTIAWHDNKPAFKAGDTFYTNESIQKVDNRFALPKIFTITAEKGITHKECYDISNIEDGPGNQTGWFSKGDTGKAIGWNKENGQEWLYVLMDRSNNNKANSYTNDGYTYGWILKSETSLK